MNLRPLILMLLAMIATSALASGQASTETSDQPPSNVVILSNQSIQAAGIETSNIIPKPVAQFIVVPGEIVPNQDTSAVIEPRIQAQVLQRLVNVGEQVAQGQPMVVLTSVEMANEQSELLMLASDWQRYQTLGSDVVTGKVYGDTQIKYQQAYSKLMAYGMTKAQVDSFIASPSPNKADGQFTLLAPIAGTVADANFALGETVEPGKELYLITNEQTLWVNAMLSSNNIAPIKQGATAIIKTGKQSVTGRVIQIHHQLDPNTRTQIVRIQIPNNNDLFHPGEFVTCHISIGMTEPVIAVPNTAILRGPDGDSIVFIEDKPGEFRPIEVKINSVQGGDSIIDGLPSGSSIVVKGAFFVNSEMQKSGFADSH